MASLAASIIATLWIGASAGNITVTDQESPVVCTENEDCYIRCEDCNGDNDGRFEVQCPTNGNCLIDCIQCNDTAVYCNGNENSECTINCMADDLLELHGCYDSIFVGGSAGDVHFNCYDSQTCGDSMFHCTDETS